MSTSLIDILKGRDRIVYEAISKHPEGIGFNQLYKEVKNTMSKDTMIKVLRSLTAKGLLNKAEGKRRSTIYTTNESGLRALRNYWLGTFKQLEDDTKHFAAQLKAFKTEPDKQKRSRFILFRLLTFFELIDEIAVRSIWLNWQSKYGSPFVEYFDEYLTIEMRIIEYLFDQFIDFVGLSTEEFEDQFWGAARIRRGQIRAFFKDPEPVIQAMKELKAPSYTEEEVQHLEPLLGKQPDEVLKYYKRVFEESLLTSDGDISSTGY